LTPVVHFLTPEKSKLKKNVTRTPHVIVYSTKYYMNRSRVCSSIYCLSYVISICIIKWHYCRFCLKNSCLCVIVSAGRKLKIMKIECLLMA